jgi:endonuclease/exonuclease/phosphatase family metal-dependent hydrolase
MTSESLQDHQPQTIRVLTFNILSTDHASWERRLQAARTGLQALRPDILALQESRRRPYLLTLEPAGTRRGDAARIGPADRLHHDQKWHSRTDSGYC